jgi:hypothetical protein
MCAATDKLVGNPDRCYEIKARFVEMDKQRITGELFEIIIFLVRLEVIKGGHVIEPRVQ